jgi:hypothetical protein
MSQRPLITVGSIYERLIAKGGKNKSDLHFTYSDKKFRVFTEVDYTSKSPTSLTMWQLGWDSV